MATSRRFLALLLVPLGLGLAGHVSTTTKPYETTSKPHVTTTKPNYTNMTHNICAHKAQPGFKLNLTAAMIFSDYILLIDGNLMVYKVPQTNYEDSYGSLVLNMGGVYIENYWPVLKGNTDWKRIKPLYKQVYHIIDSKGHFYVYIVPPNGSGICINMLDGKLGPPVQKIQKRTNDDKFEQLYFDDASYAYSMILVDGLPMLYAWKFEFSKPNGTDAGSDFSIIGRVYYAVETENPANRYVMIIKGSKYMVTPENDPLKKTPGFEGYHLENVTDWHLDPDYPPVGYLYKGTFHLYVFDKVIIFKDTIPSHKNQLSDTVKGKDSDGEIIASTELKVVKLAQFFKCPGDHSQSIAPPHFPPTHSKHTKVLPTESVNLGLIISKSFRWGIVVVVLTVLIAISCGIFCFFTEGASTREDHQGQQKTAGSRIGGSQNTALSMGTSKETLNQSYEPFKQNQKISKLSLKTSKQSKETLKQRQKMSKLSFRTSKQSHGSSKQSKETLKQNQKISKSSSRTSKQNHGTSKKSHQISKQSHAISGAFSQKKKMIKH